jgi:hypothetical protein
MMRVVDVGDESRLPVELGVVCLVHPPEEALGKRIGNAVLSERPGGARLVRSLVERARSSRPLVAAMASTIPAVGEDREVLRTTEPWEPVSCSFTARW